MALHWLCTRLAASGRAGFRTDRQTRPAGGRARPRRLGGASPCHATPHALRITRDEWVSSMAFSFSSSGNFSTVETFDFFLLGRLWSAPRPARRPVRLRSAPPWSTSFTRQIQLGWRREHPVQKSRVFILDTTDTNTHGLG